MKGGLQKNSIQNSDRLVSLYLDAIKFAPTNNNLKTKFDMLLSSDFTFILKPSEKQSDKSKFIKYCFNNKKKYENSDISQTKINDNEYVLNFKKGKTSFNQHIFINNDTQIYEIVQMNLNNLKGGVGYSYSVLQPPVAGQPVVQGYLDCCRPVFPGGLTQAGGNGGLGCYLGINQPHFNVVPQYKAYDKGLEPIYSNLNTNESKMFTYQNPK